MRRLAFAILLALPAALPASLSARDPVHARRAMAVTIEQHATDIAASTLQSGGNAIDAAVAAGFALAVTHPSAGNIGGGGFMLIRLADGRATFIDFRERAPAAASHDMYLDAEHNPTQDSVTGYKASGIPGTVKGFEFAHQKYGHKPWKDLVQPAVDLARNGFPVSWSLAQALSDSDTVERLTPFANSRRIFLRDGKPYEMGDAFLQPELAATLERIRDKGAAGFYSGETARLLAADMREHGGLITEDDLKNYKVFERSPLTGAYHGYTVVTAPPPSSGGIGILEMMGILDGTDFFASGAGSAHELHFEAEAMRRFFANRSQWMGDPDFFQVPVQALLDPAYIETLRASIKPDQATPSSEIHAAAFEVHESANTTHFSIVDALGNAVAVTYTLNDSFGSGVTAARLGFLLNDEMDDFAAKPGSPNLFGLIQGEANAVAPGKTPLSSMTPTILVKDGKLFAVLGTPGGPTIINSVLQVALNLIDFKMNAQQAVDQPRIHQQWMPDVLYAEDAISPDTLQILRQQGYAVELRRRIGEMAVIRVDGDWLEGAPDSRQDGAAKGY